MIAGFLNYLVSRLVVRSDIKTADADARVEESVACSIDWKKNSGGLCRRAFTATVTSRVPQGCSREGSPI